MLRKVCNYLAIMALCLIASGLPVSANPSTPEGKAKTKTVVVNRNKNFNFYRAVINSADKHSYTVKVKAGEELKIRIHSAKGVALGIRTPKGETKSYSSEKLFEVRLRAEGEYVFDLESLFVSEYSLEILSK